MNLLPFTIFEYKGLGVFFYRHFKGNSEKDNIEIEKFLEYNFYGFFKPLLQDIYFTPTSVN